MLSTVSQGSSKIIMWLSNNKNLELGLEKVVPAELVPELGPRSLSPNFHRTFVYWSHGWSGTALHSYTYKLNCRAWARPISGKIIQIWMTLPKIGLSYQSGFKPWDRYSFTVISWELFHQPYQTRNVRGRLVPPDFTWLDHLGILDKLGHQGPVEIEVPAMIDINTESIVMSINTKIMFNYNRTCTP